MSSDEVTRLEDLLQHAGWLRQLAANLVGSAHDADDVVQEVWRATLAAQPEQVRQPRAWLASAVRNVVGMGFRSGGRRQRREQDREAMRPVEAPSAAELVAEQDLRRDLIARVDRLPAEERDVVLLRFWQDLPPREVSKRLGIPVNTVRSRTARALERLRGELDRQHGDRRAWCLLLVPLLDEGALRAVGAAPGVGGAKAAVIAAAACVLLGGGYAIYAELTAWDPIDLSRATPASDALARFDAAAGASAVASDAAAARTATITETSTRTFVGQVVDLDGRPIGGATLHREDQGWFDALVRRGKILAADWTATTDADGTFRFGPEAFGYWTPTDTLKLGGLTHPYFVAELEWVECPLGQPARLQMRRAFDALLEIEVVEKGTGLPVPRFVVSVAAHWGRSSSSDPKVRIAGDPQLRWLSSIVDHDLRQSGVDGAMRRPIRLVEGADNQLRVTIAGAGVFKEQLPVPERHGEVLHRRYEVEFDAAAKVAGNVVLGGKVVDALTGAPICGAVLRLADGVGGDEPPFPTIGATMSRPDGSFRLGHAPDKTRGKLGVRHPDYASGSFADVGPGNDAVLRLQPLATMTAQFVSRGRPQPGLFVLALWGDSDPYERRRLVTDADGKIALDHLPAGTVSLYVTPRIDDPDEAALDNFRVRVQPGEARDVRLEFSPPERVVVSGTVLRGRDVEVVMVPVFVPLDGEHGWVQAQRLGSAGYLAGGMRRGDYLVMLVPASDRDRDGPFAFAGVVSVGAAVTQVVDVALPDGSVVGRVEGLDGCGDRDTLRVVVVPKLPQRSLAATQLLGFDKLAAMVGAPIDAFGQFEVKRVADGPCELQLRRGAEVLATLAADVRMGRADVGTWRVAR